MTKRTLGLLAGVLGSAFGSWLFARRRAMAYRSRHITPAREQGTVIFDNTPTAPARDAF